MRLSTRLFLYVFTLILCLGTTLAYLSVTDERAHLLQEAKSKTRLFARTIAASLRYYHPAEPVVAMERILVDIARDQPEAPYLRLYDREGNPLSLDCPTCANLTLPHRPLDVGALGAKGREELLRVGNAQYLSVVEPLRDEEGMFQGAVEVVLPLHEVSLVLASVMRRFLLFALAIVALVGAAIYLVVRLGLTLPIRRLKDAAQGLGEGDLSLRIDRSGVADLDELMDEFNRMAERIEEQNQKREASYQEKLRLERSLRHTEKLASIGQLTSGLAHELGTPLNVIAGRAEQVRNTLLEDSAARRSLDTVVRQVGRIADLIRQLLAFSRKTGERFAEVDVGGTIREAFELCQLRMKREQRSMALDLTLSEERIVGDPDGLRQLFVNLMLNSLQAASGPGRIRISLAPEDEGGRRFLRIVYDDDGPGIAAGLRERVFDPFFTTKDVGEGTGLGLFIAANVVEEHEGRIEAAEAPGGGARFIIRLPRDLRPKAEETP